MRVASPGSWLAETSLPLRLTDLSLRVCRWLSIFWLAVPASLVSAIRADDAYTFTRLEGSDKGMFWPNAVNAKGQIVGDLYPAAISLADPSIRDRPGAPAVRSRHRPS